MRSHRRKPWTHLAARLERFMLAATLAIAATASARGQEADALSPSERLAQELVNRVMYIVHLEPITVQGLEIAKILVDEAIALAPDDPEICRLDHGLAILSEDRARYTRALERLVRLDPDDDAASLRWITLSLERYQDADQRLEAYQRLQDEPSLSAPIKSRLWLDRALLHRRRGEIDAFSDALAEAVSLDPANRTAVAIAAGFFRLNVDDPYAEAELLLNLALADPTDIPTQTMLGRLLLDHGAYNGAFRMYRIAADNFAQLREAPAEHLVADYVVAAWASGDPEAALAVIDKHQNQLNSSHYNQLQRDNKLAAIDDDARARAWAEIPGGPPADPAARLAREKRVDFLAVYAKERDFLLTRPLYPLLATVRVALLHDRDPDDPRLVDAVEWAVRSHDAVYDMDVDQGREDPAGLASLRLGKALIAAWGGADPQLVRQFVAEADGHMPLSDEAKQRFEGLIALRAGETERAIELLEPIAADDIYSQVGLADALLQLGRKRDAARHLLAIARRDPGMVTGVWAANRLAIVLGQRIPVSTDAHRLEELMSGLPRVADRYARKPTHALSVDVRGAKRTFRPYEPVVVFVEITNNFGLPLAIDRDGPIRPQVLLSLKTSFESSEQQSEMPAIIVDIGRRLRLEPFETLVVPVYLAWHELGEELARRMLDGELLQVQAVLNFRVAPSGAIQPSLLGSKSSTGTIRIEGIRPTDEWRQMMLAAIEEMDDPEDNVRVALLCQLRGKIVERNLNALMERQRLRSRLDEESRKRDAELEAMVAREDAVLTEISDAIVAAWGKMDPIAQAWLLGVASADILPEPLMQMAVKSDDRLVQMMFILTKVQDPNDPMIDAGRRSEDPGVRAIAEAAAMIMGGSSAPATGVGTDAEARPRWQRPTADDTSGGAPPGPTGTMPPRDAEPPSGVGGGTPPGR